MELYGTRLQAVGRLWELYVAQDWATWERALVGAPAAHEPKAGENLWEFATWGRRGMGRERLGRLKLERVSEIGPPRDGPAWADNGPGNET